MASVAWVATFTNIAFLWQNVVGAVAVVVAGLVVSEIDRSLIGDRGSDRGSGSGERRGIGDGGSRQQIE